MVSNHRTRSCLVFNKSLPAVPNGLNSALSDLFVTCQLLADNKPLTIPFQTSHKTFKNSYTSAIDLTLPKSLAELSYQVERMDHATDPLLRPPTKLTDHIYCMGYSGTSRSGASGWYNFPVVQQKMVCCSPDLFCRCAADALCSAVIGRCGGGSIDYCCGQVEKLTGVWRPRRRVSQETETRWGGWKR